MFDRIMNFNTLLSAVDIAIVSFLFYRMMIMVKQTRAVQLLKGVLVLLVVAFISNLLQLQTVSWLLAQFQTMLIVALPIIFQPELRKALERLGKGRFFGASLASQEIVPHLVDEIARAVRNLSASQTGALLVIERSTGLNDYVDSGVSINADISCELLESLFNPKGSLHDGAAIIRDGKLYAAGCILPLTEDTSISKSLGTRHRAALGISEVSDAFVIVVSEESGVVSVVEEGRMTRHLDDAPLRKMLAERVRGDMAENAFSLLSGLRKSMTKK